MAPTQHQHGERNVDQQASGQQNRRSRRLAITRGKRTVYFKVRSQQRYA